MIVNRVVIGDRDRLVGGITGVTVIKRQVDAFLARPCCLFILRKKERQKKKKRKKRFDLTRLSSSHPDDHKSLTTRNLKYIYIR